VTTVLNLPPGYFPEVREAAVVERLRADPELRDKLYQQLGIKDG
jgi:hypothetical protein